MNIKLSIVFILSLLISGCTHSINHMKEKSENVKKDTVEIPDTSVNFMEFYTIR